MQLGFGRKALVSTGRRPEVQCMEKVSVPVKGCRLFIKPAQKNQFYLIPLANKAKLSEFPMVCGASCK